MAKQQCAGTNVEGERCARRPERDHFLCRFHQRVETPEQSEAIVKHFWRDMVAQGRALEPDLVLLVMALGWEDDELRPKFVAMIEEDAARRARESESREAEAPHPSSQLADRKPKREGAYQTRRPDPPPPEDDVEIIFEDVTEDIQ